MKERIKDYRLLNLHCQNYFRGNTAARCARIRKIQKLIWKKQLRYIGRELVSLLDWELLGTRGF